MALTLPLFQLVVLVATLSPLFVCLVNAHGYVTAPASRAYFCKEGEAKNCGEIQYEPQSIEALKGLPFARNGDGKLCSAGLAQFSELDRQGAKAWPTTKANDVHSFSWTFTAQHATTDFKYFITKPDWNSTTTEGLTASEFESDPFLVVPMNGKPPPRTMNHDLGKNMPTRTGYHVVYAVWTVNNTANAFYQCIDLTFGGNSSCSGNECASPSTSSASAAGVGSANTSSVTGNTSATASPASGTNSSSASSSDSDNNASTGSGSGSSGNASKASTAGASGNSSGATASPLHRNHAKEGAACRMKRRRAPSASVLAARGGYRQQKWQMLRKRQP